MRGVSIRRAGVLLALIVVLVAPVAVAEELPAGPPPPPEARLGNPGGRTAEEPSVYELVIAWFEAFYARLGNPGG